MGLCTLATGSYSVAQRSSMVTVRSPSLHLQVLIMMEVMKSMKANGRKTWCMAKAATVTHLVQSIQVNGTMASNKVTARCNMLMVAATMAYGRATKCTEKEYTQTLTKWSGKGSLSMELLNQSCRRSCKQRRSSKWREESTKRRWRISSKVSQMPLLSLTRRHFRLICRLSLQPLTVAAITYWNPILNLKRNFQINGTIGSNFSMETESQ